MSKIFISYRREDSPHVTGRINDRLRTEFGSENIFTDVDNIPLGVDFRKHIDDQVRRCDVLLAVIGARWLAASANDRRRLDQPQDFVRTEIESALGRDIPVIPLLVDGATMPGEDVLPSSVKNLAYRNGMPVRPDPDFHADLDRLVRTLRQVVARSESPEPARASAGGEGKPNPRRWSPSWSVVAAVVVVIAAGVAWWILTPTPGPKVFGVYLLNKGKRGEEITYEMLKVVVGKSGEDGNTTPDQFVGFCLAADLPEYHLLANRDIAKCPVQ